VFDIARETARGPSWALTARQIPATRPVIA
jgi:hypothetical protein